MLQPAEDPDTGERYTSRSRHYMSVQIDHANRRVLLHTEVELLPTTSAEEGGDGYYPSEDRLNAIVDAQQRAAREFNGLGLSLGNVNGLFYALEFSVQTTVLDPDEFVGELDDYRRDNVGTNVIDVRGTYGHGGGDQYRDGHWSYGEWIETHTTIHETGHLFAIADAYVEDRFSERVTHESGLYGVGHSGRPNDFALTAWEGQQILGILNSLEPGQWVGLDGFIVPENLQGSERGLPYLDIRVLR
jgi:hypothetical protein